MTTLKRIQFIFLITNLLITYPLNAQKDFSIRANAGIASGVKFVDGYYFSFDIGIPIIKSLEIAPTFSCASMIPNTFMYNSWHETYGQPTYGVPIEGPRQEQEYGDMLSSLSILILFKPFDLIKNDRFAKHELLIGAGYGYKSYTMVSSQYDLDNGDYELVGFSYKSNHGFEPYYGKIGYNFLYKANQFFGVSIGIDGYDGEAELLAGLQFGVKF